MLPGFFVISAPLFGHLWNLLLQFSTFSLCYYTNEKEQSEYPQKVDSHYSKVINYIETMRFHYGNDALFM